MTDVRPPFLMVVAGTGTEVGKTWVGAALARVLRDAGVRIAARKPAQSYDDLTAPTDADILASATGEAPDAVCPRHRCYPLAMAPPMAAEALGMSPPRLEDLVDELRWDPSVQVGLVESAGGVASPLASDGDTASLVAALAPQIVLLVADAGLGTIDSVRLAHDALVRRGGAEVVILLNRFDTSDLLHNANAAWLADRDHLTVFTDVGAVAERIRLTL
ncbi:MAG: dethiobiotin synthase [Acidimicrobiia bacterium]|nr:dethiobiotin synthase [Acidimicrobiia bacterium]